jgi:hypothetical protein
MRINSLNIALSFFLLVVIMLVSCGGDPVVTEESYTYKIVEIDGMTCIKWSTAIGYQGGLTCNWDEWEKGE